MRKGGGKAKGAQFERDCCRMLSLWVSNGEQEDCFWRSAMSGGRSTVAFAKGKRLTAQAGDITCTSPTGMPFAKRFLAECKFYRDLDFLAAIDRKGRFAKFWRTISNEAVAHNRHPMLFAKQNRTPLFICLGWQGMLFLGYPTALAAITFPGIDAHLILADRFFKECKPPRE